MQLLEAEAGVQSNKGRFNLEKGTKKSTTHVQLSNIQYHRAGQKKAIEESKLPLLPGEDGTVRSGLC